MRVLSNFDRSFTEALVNKAKSRLMFKGHLKTYRFCDEVWTFIIKNPQFRFENETLQVDKVKIVACNSKKPGEI
ncbi:Transcription initiation factor IIA subunit 2 [Neolecta irregularis DAH-3]|uniref:Transcription initiation factor IIA subunit 2 n=1 Tax=Neolecta irregularis (strain DAH-3) TaxID=1198029 RepID=A0A1U7LM69_NEOID|nr:Transcription initiation factor IIA subunit 2 [Neolecta irregularis DAH-3]|eukprot:OLL23755.1 Transcription initiation factor IIA subunit 2 [Neolecta irregularis DAH-3]